MTKICIAGIGSWYGNDNTGIDIVSELEKAYPHNQPDEEVCFFISNAVHDLLAFMSSPAQENIRHLYVIDAIARTRKEPHIQLFALEDLAHIKSRTSSHGAELTEVLQLLSLLYYPNLPISIIGIAATDRLSKQETITQIIQKIPHRLWFQ